MKRLYIVPSSIAEGDKTLFFPSGNIVHIANIDVFFVENLRSARRFLRYLDKTFPIDEKTFFELSKHHNQQFQIQALLRKDEYQTYGVISEAGYPGIADPGSEIIKQAHHLHIKVMPLVGPSAIFMALAASGLNGQNFAFQGYLPVKKPLLIKTLKRLEETSRKNNQTQIFIETPYRNESLLKTLLNHLSDTVFLTIASDIGGREQVVYTKTVGEWKNLQHSINIHKKPTVFLFQA